MTDNFCSVGECEKLVRCKGLCETHYKRFIRYGNPLTVIRVSNKNKQCSIDECGGDVKANGLCINHYTRYRRANNMPSSTNPDIKICAVPDCNRSAYCKNFCHPHYKRNLTYGDPLAGGTPLGLSLEDRFSTIVKTKTVDENGCWTPVLKQNKNGYTRLRANGKAVPIHRVSLHLFDGFDLDSKEQVHHKCANRACFNPDHLQPVTARENVAEMHERNFYLKEIERLKAELAQALRTIEELQEASTVRG